MQLHVFFRYKTWEITCEWQNHNFASNKMSPKHYMKCHKQQKRTLKKLLGWQVFKNHNCNPFQSSSILSICASYCIYCVSYTLLWRCQWLFSCFTQFWWPFPVFEFYKFRGTAPLRQLQINKTCRFLKPRENHIRHLRLIWKLLVVGCPGYLLWIFCSLRCWRFCLSNTQISSEVAKARAKWAPKKS